jgi:hypothetical protein
LKRLDSDKEIQAFFLDSFGGLGWILLDLAKFGFGLD